ncbi:MAG: phosphoglycerate dehydrogenase [Bacillota bacterium]|jgi:D-3-phosphoglycerate dehydrogenase
MFNVKKLNKIAPVIYDYLPKEEYKVSSGLDGFDALMVRSANCHEIELPERLLTIVRAGAGTNNIPVDACTEKGIVVFNTPGANANGVKELVIGSMIAAARNLFDAYAWAQTLKGKGDQVPSLIEQGKKQFVGGELKGKTLGVIGLGAVGVMVANTATEIGMNVIGYDPFMSVEQAWTISTRAERAEQLEDLLNHADYISLHIPQNEHTKNFLCTREFSKMKPGVILLNFARGGLVKTISVLDAIEAGIVAKYVTDFPDGDLIGQKNIIAIPHLGASTPESEENCAMMAAQQLRDFLEEGTIVNSVNLPECVLAKSGKERITLIHKNTPNMVGQITNAIADHEINIADMVNKSKGDIAYTVLNLDQPINQGVLEELNKISGMIRTRVICSNEK